MPNAPCTLDWEGFDSDTWVGADEKGAHAHLYCEADGSWSLTLHVHDEKILYIEDIGSSYLGKLLAENTFDAHWWRRANV